MRQMVLELNASDDRGIDVVRCLTDLTGFTPREIIDFEAGNKSKPSAAPSRFSQSP